MYRKRLGVATVSLTACALFSSIGSANAAAGTHAGAAESTIARFSEAVPRPIPVSPRKHGSGHHGGGPTYNVFTLDESARRSSSTAAQHTLIALGNVYAPSSSTASGSIAADDTLARRTAHIGRQAARAPPCDCGPVSAT